MKIMISGSSGFIGGYILKRFTDCGHTLQLLLRNIDEEYGDSVSCIMWELGQELLNEDFSNVDALIHLAYDFSGSRGAERSLAGTLKLFKQAQAAGVRKQVLVSSYSSGSHAQSVYGITKYKLERYFVENNQVVVRPGLVIGEGGLYGRIKHVSHRWPIIPLPDGGRGEMPIIDVMLLSTLLLQVVEDTSDQRDYNLFEPELVSLRKLVLRSASEVGRKPLIIPIPSLLILLGLKFLEFLRVKLPVNSDNLNGFLSNQGAEHQSSLTSKLELLK